MERGTFRHTFTSIGLSDLICRGSWKGAGKSYLKLLLLWTAHIWMD